MYLRSFEDPVEEVECKPCGIERNCLHKVRTGAGECLRTLYEVCGRDLLEVSQNYRQSNQSLRFRSSQKCFLKFIKNTNVRRILYALRSSKPLPL